MGKQVIFTFVMNWFMYCSTKKVRFYRYTNFLQNNLFWSTCLQSENKIF